MHSSSVSKTPVEDLPQLIKKRQEMRQQLDTLKTRFQEKILSPSEFYKRFEKIGLSLFQINANIQTFDPDQDEYILQAIQL